jgi:uncharacterized protein YjiS (DUF1127 family)
MAATLPQQPSPAVLRLRADRRGRASKPAGRTARFRAVLGGVLVRLVEGIVSWDERVRDRRRLASLDDRTLRDIGIDRAAVENDSTTGFWRLR